VKHHLRPGRDAPTTRPPADEVHELRPGRLALARIDEPCERLLDGVRSPGAANLHDGDGDDHHAAEVEGALAPVVGGREGECERQRDRDERKAPPRSPPVPWESPEENGPDARDAEGESRTEDEVHPPPE
jgi:hypothetical protein